MGHKVDSCNTDLHKLFYTPKIPALRESIGKYKEKNHILVYCGATTVRDYGYQEGVPTSEEIRQIDAVTDLLGNQMGFRVAQFTSKEDALTRSKLIKSFDQGEMIQALIAIRCLDEGVNIPSIDKAFILASSTNPKEYIQRRGRVLRLYPGKNYAQIYDFITLPIPLDKVKGYATEDISGFKGLAKRELIRMMDFAKIAQNPYEIDTLIRDIKNAYDIEDEELERESEEEWDD